MKALLKILVVLAILSFGSGCQVIADQCNGLHNYDATEWSKDEIESMRDGIELANTWMGKETLYLHAAFPHEIAENKCMIHPGDLNPVGAKGPATAGEHQAYGGNITLDLERIYKPWASYEENLVRLKGTLVHEVLHGLGFDHVESKGNVMYPSGVSDIDSNNFGAEDTQQCKDLGFCD